MSHILGWFIHNSTHSLNEAMTKIVKISLSASIFFCVLSLSTCLLGPMYEARKIPPEIRGRMTDTDWIGVEWVAIGGILFLLGLAIAVGGLAIWYRQRHRRAANGPV